MSAVYSLWLSSPAGVRLKLIDNFLRLEYTRAVNNVGVLKLDLPADFPLTLLAIDGRLEVWRRAPGGLRYLDTETVWFIRDVARRLNRRGERFITVIAYSAADLLRRRIVAYAAGSSQAEKTGKADDLMKAIVRENLGASAATGRNISAYLSVQADLSAGPSLSKAFSRRNVLTVLQELGQAAVEAGMPTFFDIVAPAVGTLEFRTYTGQRGGLHSTAGVKAVILSPSYGTLSDVNRRYDHSAESNYVYAGGQGEEGSRAVATASDTARIATSPLNRCENWVDARNTADSGLLTAEAQASLRAGRPRQVFSGTILNTEAVQYGREWFFGDKISAEFDGEVVTGRVDEINVLVENGEENITTELRVEL